MFESDDYDEILSQLDLPNPCSLTQPTERKKEKINDNENKSDDTPTLNTSQNKSNDQTKCSNSDSNFIEEKMYMSPKHIKRKLINSYFDHKSKRKFPGPAGLLNGTFEESHENDICHVELLSQDLNYSQSYLHKNIFDSPLWDRLLRDIKDFAKVDTIKNIKQQALKGNLQHRKAEAITGFVESVDRSAVDPLIVLRDVTENIKCTLHRDAWVAFSPYIVSDCCALVLRSPTVLTTGSAFKKHYLNITLSNIHAVYSSTIIKREDEQFPNGFNKIYEKDFTIIKNEKQNSVINSTTGLFEDSDILYGLDGAFGDDLFA